MPINVQQVTTIKGTAHHSLIMYQQLILGVKEAEVGTRDLVRRRRGAINRNVSQSLENIPTGSRC